MQTSFRFLTPVLLGTALAVLLVIAFVNYRQATFTQDIYSTYFDARPSHGYLSERSLAVKESELDEVLQAGLNAHSNQDYSTALVYFRAYLEDNPEPEDFRPYTYAATAAMAVGELEEAAAWLHQLPPTGSPASADRTWYLSLIDLRRDQPEAARLQLQELASNNVDRRMARQATAVMQAL
ncbi:MAG: hypothetical protein WBA17_13225 [Saprospiraceae bacterium]